MSKPKLTPYDDQESQILRQSASFVDFLQRRGVLEDPDIDSERVRKAKKDTAQKAYHNTKILLEQYRQIVWVLECIPNELAEELSLHTQGIDALAEKIDIEMSLENKKLENRMNAIMRTRLLVDRIQDALTVVRKHPDNGQRLYDILYATYISPISRSHAELIEHLGISSRTYYRFKKEAIRVMSLRLWAAPTAEVGAWLEILTMMEKL